ncbi:hypothetical protein SKAU_G00068740 [Synaphobranchus kaupii]|uniref:Uncharacterized protein n=1 Tax=Synaphobranchus kaupii TaxID=118154 RepID=A0A9Q1G6C0_SYNKA|nr:hypothetical protein SKAU_G00068740 [Synaphobranchus kaupii]
MEIKQMEIPNTARAISPHVMSNDAITTAGSLSAQSVEHRLGPNRLEVAGLSQGLAYKAPGKPASRIASHPLQPWDGAGSGQIGSKGCAREGRSSRRYSQNSADDLARNAAVRGIRGPEGRKAGRPLRAPWPQLSSSRARKGPLLNLPQAAADCPQA